MIFLFRKRERKGVELMNMSLWKKNKDGIIYALCT